MKNSPQSPAGFNVVNFPSQLEKRKERRRECYRPELQRWCGIWREAVAEEATYSFGLFLKGGSRRVNSSQHPTHEWMWNPRWKKCLPSAPCPWENQTPGAAG